jgi:hypothetical protein
MSNKKCWQQLSINLCQRKKFHKSLQNPNMKKKSKEKASILGAKELLIIPNIMCSCLLRYLPTALVSSPNKLLHRTMLAAQSRR